MFLNELIITQEELRRPDQLTAMIKMVKKGVIFNQDTLGTYDKNSVDLMEIAEFPDGAHYLHNGHHRGVAMYLAGRTSLTEEEFYIKKWKYEDYLGVNFELEYFTPFDIKKEIRIPNLKVYKSFIQQVVHEFGEELAKDIIMLAKGLFTKKRTMTTLEELSARYTSYKGNF